jgi:hypothetical protein
LLFPGVTYSFSFPACSNFVYVASSQTFSKLTFSFQKPVFQISERIPKNIIEGNNFTIFIDIKTNATNYKLIIQQANKTKTFELSGGKSIGIESKAESNLLNLSIIYNNEVAVSKIIQLNISKPSFTIATKAPNAIIIGKNFTLALNVSTDFEGNYTLVVNYANQTKIKKAIGNSSFSFNFEATPQPIIVSIFYLSYNITKIIQPNYIQQPQVFVKVITQANQTTLSFDFRNYAKNITIRIGNLTWFFNSENNSREEIKIFGYGNFVCNVTFQDLLGNFYNASFSFSNPKPKTEETFFVVFVAFIVAIVIFVFLYKLMHH